MENFIFWFQDHENDASPYQLETDEGEQRIRQLEESVSRCQRHCAVEIGALKQMVDFLIFLFNKTRPKESASTGANSRVTPNRIQSNYIDLTKAISVDIHTVVLYLYQKNIVSDVMKADIMSESQNPFRRASKLLDIIHGSGEQAYNSLYQATLEAKLWSAADLLRPGQSPHRRAVDGCPQAVATEDDSVDGPCHSGLLYARSDSCQFDDIQVQLDYLKRTVNELQRCMRRARGQSESNIFADDSNAVDISIWTKFSNHQKVVENHQAPIGENTYAYLAALEYIAKVDNGPAYNIGGKTFPGRFRSQVETRIQEFKADKYTPHRAATEYIMKTVPLPHLPEVDKFYLVYVLSSNVRKCKILAISNSYVKFLNSETKEETDSWQIKDIKGCVLEHQNRQKLTLEIQNGGSVAMHSDELIAQTIAMNINYYISQLTVV